MIGLIGPAILFFIFCVGWWMSGRRQRWALVGIVITVLLILGMILVPLFLPPGIE